eukprot:XP_001695941.1 predicted protein [Chlamydomonas reinhardtii]
MPSIPEGIHAVARSLLRLNHGRATLAVSPTWSPGVEQGGQGAGGLLSVPHASSGGSASASGSSSDERAELEGGSMLDEDVSALFSHAMPKHEIGALRFLQDHPEYDGRGVKICIFDTGVDPGAAGLQITTDGKPKIIDIIDCTGSGDVDTSRVEKADVDGCIAGASGRKLRLNPDWKNPTGEWRVGCKHVYGLVSRGLVSRLKEERKRKWEETQRGAIAEAVAALAKWVSFSGGKGKTQTMGPRAAGPRSSRGQEARFDKDTPASKLGSDPEAKKERAELEGRVAALKARGDLAKSYEDPGPLIDAVVWHDGAAWRAALDTSALHPAGSGAGALAAFTPLTNYADEHKYGTFSELDACNFVLNILDGGRTLSVVVDCGAHGTHVAGITAAHFPDDPGSNGIAPGAQIISCKIGDTRLGSMETGTGVVRGLIAARQHGAHLINMSYGEPTTTPNAGRFIELATELVRKHGVIFVASAGNAGPALTTVGAPGGTSSALFGVGAYVSPQLAAAGHSVLEAPAEGLQYNWSSRGPTSDGHTGVAFSAPGGAIAPVPQWTQQVTSIRAGVAGPRRQLMNGTSMSSPNACGGIALLLSGLLATGGALAPHRLRRALENTATPLGGGAPDAVLTYGRGLIQIDAAWEYLMNDGVPPAATSPTAAGPWPLSPGVMRVEAMCAEGRGPRGRGIYIREPHESAKPQSYRVSVTPKLNEDAATSARLDVEDRLLLEPSVPWITCPPALMVHSAGRSFDVRMCWWTPAACRRACTTARAFVAVPPGATWAEMTLRAGPYDTPKLFLLRGTQLRPDTSYRQHELRTQVTLSGGSEYNTAWEVVGGCTLELTLAQFWTSAGASQLETVELSFYGVELAAEGGSGSRPGTDLALDGAELARKVLVSAPAWSRATRIRAEAKLTHLNIPLRPSESSLEPLTAARDALTEGRVVYRLLLTYKTTAGEAGKYKPCLPLINHQIYDSPLESQLLLVSDGATRQLLSTQDAGPEPVTLKKGAEVVLRLALRHDNQEVLDKMRSLPLVLKRVLDGSGVSLPDRLPKDATPGRLLTGTLTLGQLKRGGGAAPHKFRISYLVPPAASPSSASGGGNGNGGAKDDAAVEKTPEEKLSEADLKLSDAPQAALYDKLLSELTSAHPGHLPLLTEHLKKLDGREELRKWVDTASEAPHLLLHAKVEARAKRLYAALGWGHWEAQEKDLQSLRRWRTLLGGVVVASWDWCGRDCYGAWGQ